MAAILKGPPLLFISPLSWFIVVYKLLLKPYKRNISDCINPLIKVSPYIVYVKTIASMFANGRHLYSEITGKLKVNSVHLKSVRFWIRTLFKYLFSDWITVSSYYCPFRMPPRYYLVSAIVTSLSNYITKFADQISYHSNNKKYTPGSLVLRNNRLDTLSNALLHQLWDRRGWRCVRIRNNRTNKILWDNNNSCSK